MIAVSNTTPILSLAKIGQLNLFNALFDKVFVPTAVYEEIAIIGKDKERYDVFDVSDLFHIKEIQNVLAANILRVQLDYGEAEAIVLAKELKADILVLDEKKARRIAQANSQAIIGTVGILQLAKEKGMISDIKTQLDGLIANGIWIGEKLYHEVLQNNNE
jgi:predicted nucleic acid-binding protein